MTKAALSPKYEDLHPAEIDSLLVLLLYKVKKYSQIILPLFYCVLMVGTIIYFVNNPGGSMGARILTYKNVITMFREHITLVLLASTAAILTSVPLGIIITRVSLRRLTPFIDNPVNIAQTVPGLAIMALFFIVFGIGIKTALFALWLYSLLPILRNTSIGIQSIDKGVMEAARGMGMHPLRILLKIELPLALPIIMAGIRTSVVVCVGSAALSTFIGAGGLGDLIVTGVSLVRYNIIYAGAILSALLAILLDNLLGSLELYLLHR
jgi:osmoprotectant transport system permease protein